MLFLFFIFNLLFRSHEALSLSVVITPRLCMSQGFAELFFSSSNYAFSSFYQLLLLITISWTMLSWY